LVVADLVRALVSPPPPGDVLSPFWLVSLAVFVAGFVVGIALDGDALAPLLPNPAVRRLLGRYARPASLLFGVGLVLFGVRVLQIDPLRLAAPVWLLLCLAVTAVYLAWAARRVREELPTAQAKAHQEAGDVGRSWPRATGDGARHPAPRS
jgi:protein-S-isoprenylcysteine O-methyltransferase Ste14